MSPLIESVSENDEIVLDGGYLLHRLIRQKESTFRDVVSKYVHYASVKDHEHKKRLLKAKVTSNIFAEVC